MPEVIIMNYHPVVIPSEGQHRPFGMPLTPPPPLNQFREVSSQEAAILRPKTTTTTSTTLPPTRRNKTVIPSKDMGDLQAVGLPVRSSFLTDVRSTVPDEHMKVFLRTQTTTAIPGSPYLLRPYQSPLPSIGHEKILEEEEEIALEANVDSPPPPTFETTIQVSKWLEQITYDNDDSEYPRAPMTPEATEDTQVDVEELKSETVETDGVSSIHTSLRPQSVLSVTSDFQEEVEEVLDKTEDKTICSADEEENDKESIDLNDIVSRMGSEDQGIRLQATVKARQHLSSPSVPETQGFLEAGILKPAVESLKSESVDLQFEAAWIITNLASGSSEDTDAVVDSGAVEILIDLLTSDAVNIREQSMWALSNIVGDSLSHRNYVVKAGVMGPLLELLKEEQPGSLTRDCCWMMCNLCRHKPHNYDQEEWPLITDAARILLSYSDANIKEDCIWSLSFLAEDSSTGRQMIIDAGMVRRLVILMNNNNQKIMKAAIIVCGHITSGDSTQIESVLEEGALEAITQMFPIYNEGITKEVLHLITNITAGTKDQVERLIQAGILPLLIRLIHEGSSEMEMEGVQALFNLTVGGHKDHIREVLSENGISILLSVLRVPVGDPVPVSLAALNNILKAFHDDQYLEDVKHIISETGGVDILETSLGHENPEVYKTARDILDNYFPVVEDFIVDEESEDKDVTLPDKATKYIINN